MEEPLIFPPEPQEQQEPQAPNPNQNENQNIPVIVPNDDYSLKFDPIFKIITFSTLLILGLVYYPKFRKTRILIDIWHDILMVLALIYT